MGSHPGVTCPRKWPDSLEHSGFATLFQSWAIVGFTLGLVIALWLIVSGSFRNWRGEPLGNTMSRDALLHGPILTGLLLYGPSELRSAIPVDWSFQPMFVVGAFVALILIRLLHLFVDTWTPAATRAALERRIATQSRWEDRQIPG